MAKRNDLYRREPRSRDRSGRTPLTTGKMWQVVGGLFLMVTGLAVSLWFLGADFDSEYRRTAWFSTSTLMGAEPRGTRLSASGVVRVVLPESFDRTISCVWWNVGSFYIVPVIALAYALKFTFSRD